MFLKERKENNKKAGKHSLNKTSSSQGCFEPDYVEIGLEKMFKMWKRTGRRTMDATPLEKLT